VSYSVPRCPPSVPLNYPAATPYRVDFYGLCWVSVGGKLPRITTANWLALQCPYKPLQGRWRATVDAGLCQAKTGALLGLLAGL